MRVIQGRSRGALVAVVPSVPTAVLTAVLTLLAFASSGCGGRGDDGADPIPVTVTVPGPTPTAPPSPAVTAPPPVPRPAAVAPMDRAFDAGLIAASRTEGDTLVLAIDRLTVAGVDDAALAATGALIEPDPGDRFGNQRVALYDVAVATDALFVVTSCTRLPEGVDMQSEPRSAAEFVASVPPDAPVLLTYTGGLVTRAEVNPRC